MSRQAVRICEYPGCAELVRYGHPYPLDAQYCTDHDPRQRAIERAVDRLRREGVGMVELRQVVAGVEAGLAMADERGDE